MWREVIALAVAFMAIVALCRYCYRRGVHDGELNVRLRQRGLDDQSEALRKALNRFM